MLLKHPAVMERAVVGAPHKTRGQRVTADVVPAKGFAPGEDPARDIKDVCRRTTEPCRYPGNLECVPERPGTISGQIRRVALRGPASLGG